MSIEYQNTPFDNLSLKSSAKVNHFFNSNNFTESVVKKLSGYLKSCSGFDKK